MATKRFIYDGEAVSEVENVNNKSLFDELLKIGREQPAEFFAVYVGTALRLIEEEHNLSILDRAQFAKMQGVVECLKELLFEDDEMIIDVTTNEAIGHGYIKVKTRVFYLCRGESYDAMRKILDYSSAMDFHVVDGEFVEIGITIPNVWQVIRRE